MTKKTKQAVDDLIGQLENHFKREDEGWPLDTDFYEGLLLSNLLGKDGCKYLYERVVNSKYFIYQIEEEKEPKKTRFVCRYVKKQYTGVKNETNKRRRTSSDNAF